MSNISKILLLGPPACGKGTQASRLSELLNLPILGTGNLLRQAMADSTELGKKAEGYINKGFYVPDELIEALVSEWTANHSEGWLFDGFPRTKKQAEFMLSQVEIGKPDLVIGFEVSQGELEKRVNSRRQCTKCDLVTSTFVHKGTECPRGNCDGKLYARNDDALDSFKVRYEQYTKLTLPLFDFYKEMGLLTLVNGELSPDQVWESVQSTITELH